MNNKHINCNCVNLLSLYIKILLSLLLFQCSILLIYSYDVTTLTLMWILTMNPFIVKIFMHWLPSFFSLYFLLFFFSCLGYFRWLACVNNLIDAHTSKKIFKIKNSFIYPQLVIPSSAILTSYQQFIHSAIHLCIPTLLANNQIQPTTIHLSFPLNSPLYAIYLLIVFFPFFCVYWNRFYIFRVPI